MYAAAVYKEVLKKLFHSHFSQWIPMNPSVQLQIAPPPVLMQVP